MKKQAVTIQKPTNTTDSEGIVTRTWSNSVTVMGTLLPSGEEITQKPYGEKLSVKYKLFVKGKVNAELGWRAVIDSKNYYIVYLADYGKVTEMWLDSVLPGGGNIGQT